MLRSKLELSLRLAVIGGVLASVGLFTRPASATRFPGMTGRADEPAENCFQNSNAGMWNICSGFSNYLNLGFPLQTEGPGHWNTYSVRIRGNGNNGTQCQAFLVSPNNIATPIGSVHTITSATFQDVIFGQHVLPSDATAFVRCLVAPRPANGGTYDGGAVLSADVDPSTFDRPNRRVPAIFGRAWTDPNCFIPINSAMINKCTGSARKLLIPIPWPESRNGGKIKVRAAGNGSNPTNCLVVLSSSNNAAIASNVIGTSSSSYTWLDFGNFTWPQTWTVQVECDVAGSPSGSVSDGGAVVSAFITT